LHLLLQHCKIYMTRFLFLLITFIFIGSITAQDTLPKFSAIKKKDGTAIISWINDFGIVKQITIQRSTDSLRRFVSIATDSAPMNRKGIFIDNKAKLVNYYYRIFIQLPEGKYLYTATQKVKRDWLLPKVVLPKVISNIYYDSIKGIFWDSTQLINDTVETGPKPFVPSDYIFTDKKGNVLITLPNAETRNFSIVFYNENDKQVLKIPKVKEGSLILERYNFYKSGWYYFELKDGNRLIEKHKFLLPPLIAPIGKQK
jgi:hypothetical protein